MSVAESEDYYISLPSNVSGPDNTISSWETRLAQTLYLNGSWELGLAQLIFVNSSDTVPDALPFEIHLKDGLKHTLKLPAGNYETPLAIIAAMSRSIARMQSKMTRRKRDIPVAEDDDEFIPVYPTVTQPVAKKSKPFPTVTGTIEKLVPEVELVARLADPVQTGVIEKKKKKQTPVEVKVQEESNESMTIVTGGNETVDVVQDDTIPNVYPEVTTPVVEPPIQRSSMKFKKQTKDKWTQVGKTAEIAAGKHEPVQEEEEETVYEDEELFDPIPVEQVLAEGKYTVVISYDSVKRRIKIDLNPDTVEKLVLSKGISFLLGFDKEEITKSSWSSYSPTTQIGTNTLYVFCDQASFNIVGDSTSNQLRIVPVTGAYGTVCDYSFNPCRYYPVRSNIISSFRIELRNDFGEKVKFHYGTAVAVLHLRKKK